MSFEIKSGPDFAVVEYTLEDGESIIAEPGAMVTASATIKAEPPGNGGALAAAKRKLLGRERVRHSTYRAQGGPGQILLAPGCPGDITRVDLAAERSLMVQSAAFLAATPTLAIDATWSGAKGFFSGMGLSLWKVTGPGTLFLASCGAMQSKRRGGEYLVNTNYVVAFEDSVTYTVHRARGERPVLKESALLARFEGEGLIYTQTRSSASLAAFLHPYRPVQSNS